MKTCKDCTYHSKVKNRINAVDSKAWYADCHLYPKVIETSSGYWCGQFKPAKDQETVRATYHKSGCGDPERLIRIVSKPGSTVTRQYSDDDGKTWSAPEEFIKETITTKDVKPYKLGVRARLNAKQDKCTPEYNADKLANSPLIDWKWDTYKHTK